MYRYFWYLYRGRLIASLMLIGIALVAFFLWPSKAPAISTATEPSTSRQPTSVRVAEPSSVYGPSGSSLADYQADLLAAFNCAQVEQGLTPAMLDATLSFEAEQLWIELQSNLTSSLDQAPGDYKFRGLIAFDPAQSPRGCAVGGFDAAALGALDGISVLGIAVFPPQMPGERDGASALILGR